jgi:integrase/recombinase XerD
VVGQVVPVNPAASVRGPKYSVSKGLTPVISAEEARELFSSMDLTSVVGLRDRAIIGVLTYTFARVSAMISLRVEDYYAQGKKWWLRLHEKNGKVNEMPCHPVLIEYLDTYMDAAGIEGERKGPLFRSAAGRSQKLTLESLDRVAVWRMIRRRAKHAGIETAIGCHTFRATGITSYIRNGGRIEIAQKMAGHSSARTTGLYNRIDDDISLDEVLRIRF